MSAIRKASALQSFQCLGDQCEDTCCKGWGMQLTRETFAKYERDAPELLEAVTSGEAEHIMRRDPETDYCVKFDQGWCGIHARYGEAFLGDACHFFPRVTRQLGEETLMTASLSCPEIVRLGIMQRGGFAYDEEELTDRLPFSLKNYLPVGLDAPRALKLHRFFLAAVMDRETSAESALLRLRLTAEKLQETDGENWAVAGEYYWNASASQLPASQANAADPFNLLNALQGLVGAAKASQRTRLMQTIDEMASALRVTLNWDRLSIETSNESLVCCRQMQARWQQEWAQHFYETLRYWLQAQLSVCLFPFAGLGETLTDRVTIIGVRLATLKLALMSACAMKNAAVPEQETVRIIQSLARFLDHLAAPALSMQIYTETGWSNPARLRALLAMDPLH